MGKNLDFYKKCMKDGLLPFEMNGLCRCNSTGMIGGDVYVDGEYAWFNLFYFLSPTQKDYDMLKREGYFLSYWGSGVKLLDEGGVDEGSVFTPLRQTIVLLMAAINDEL